MYEHPYLSQQVVRFEQEQIVRDAERRRFLREHADQIVPRPEGAIRRTLRRILEGRTDAARPASSARTVGARSANVRTAGTRVVDDGVGAGCEPATATATAR